MTPPLVPNSVPFSTVVSTVQQVAQSLSMAATAIDTLAKSEPVKLLVRARTVSAIKSGLPWVVAPLVAGGLAYWGVRAWQRRANAQNAVGTSGEQPAQAHPA